MPRPKRPGGTTSDEWPAKLNKFFAQHPKLSRKGVACVLTDIAEANGYKAISVHALYKYCAASARRRPTDRFLACWPVFENIVAEFEGEDIAVRTKGGKHVLAVVEGEIETIWIPNPIFLKRCGGCSVLFIGQHNAKKCPDCRPRRKAAVNRV